MILTILTTIASVGTALVKSLAIIGMAIQGLKVIGNVLIGIAKALGIIKPETDVRELGDKALQAEEAGMKPENYPSFAEYVKAVDNFTLDPEKSKLTTEEEKLGKGIELGCGVMVEKFPELPIKEFSEFMGKNPEYFNAGKIAALFDLAAKDGKTFTEVVGYMTGKEKQYEKIDSAVSALTKIEKIANPDISDRDALKAVMEIRK